MYLYTYQVLCESEYVGVGVGAGGVAATLKPALVRVYNKSASFSSIGENHKFIWLGCHYGCTPRAMGDTAPCLVKVHSRDSVVQQIAKNGARATRSVARIKLGLLARWRGGVRVVGN